MISVLVMVEELTLKIALPQHVGSGIQANPSQSQNLISLWLLHLAQHAASVKFRLQVWADRRANSDFSVAPP